MARETLDGRLVTRCDTCGAEVGDDNYAGVPGLTEFLGIGICPDCREEGLGVAEALFASGMLSERGERAVHDWLLLQAPDDLRDLAALLREDDETAQRLQEGRDN